MDAVKLYEDFEREVDPRRQSANGVVVQYGFPGSGSTFMWQVVNAMVGDVRKTHNCPEYDPKCKVIATVRDFRDILCTYLKRANLPATRASIDFLVNVHGSGPESFADLNRVLDLWGDRQNILWMKYERFVGDFDYIFDTAGPFLGVSLDQQRRDEIVQEFSMEANRVRSNKAETLCTQQGGRGWLDKNWVRYTVGGINGMHITGDGSVGKWRTDIPEDLHAHVADLLREPLTRYGYL